MTLNSTIFSVLHVNTRSVLAHNNTTKLDEIELLAAEDNFTVVCLTETWLDNSIDKVTVQLNGYADPFRLDRNRHGGGVLAYVKNDIFCVRRFDYESDDVEILWLELKTSNFRCRLRIFVRIFVVFILQCATFHQILTLFSSKSLPIPYLLY